MARLTFPIIPLLALLLLVAHTCCAFKHRSCSKQLESLNLNHCEKHITAMIQHDEKEGNYIRKQPEEDHQEKCCNELSELNSPKCQCTAMQKIMESQSQKLQGKEKLQVEKRLMTMPMMCGLAPSPLIGCDLRQED